MSGLFVFVTIKTPIFCYFYRMNRGIIFSAIITLFYFNIIAQNKIDTLRLFYNINQIHSEDNSKRIDSLVSLLHGKTIKIKIYGYADFLHSNEYNQTLSQKRADAVKTRVFEKMLPSQINTLVCKGMGEKFSQDNNSPKGEAFQRRVDVIIEQLISVKSNTKVPESNSENPPKKNTKTIESLSKGESLSLEGLNFEPGRHYVVKESVAILYKLLKTLQTNKKLKIEIQGHICCLTEGEDGMDIDTHENKLSQNRAKSVYDFLVTNGIDPARLSYKGFGRSRPKIFPETSPEEEQMNRRVEIMIVEK